MNRSLYYLQSPVGNDGYIRILSGSSKVAGHGLEGIENWETVWLRSGTMALATAVTIACRKKFSAAPRVLVPGYGCPDLVSALRYAGAQPVYCDMLPGSTRMNIGTVEEKLRASPDIVAVIGVDLFGVPENWAELRRITQASDVFLIQDFAQSFQSRSVLSTDLLGDAVVFSFGRGKPVCCMGGGAMLLPQGGEVVGSELLADCRQRAIGSLLVKNSLYRQLLRPMVYAQFARMMGNRLGQTRYIPLEDIAFLPSADSQRADRAIARYWLEHSDRAVDLIPALQSVLDSVSDDDIRFPAEFLPYESARRFSRVPLLVRDRQRRSQLMTRLRRAGISATTMYSRALPAIVAEYDEEARYDRLEHAEAFAGELITLPVHARLTDRDIQAIAQVVSG